MKKIINTLVYTVFVLSLTGLAHISHAQEVVVENDSGVSARAMGMGGAQIAASEDVTAVIYNPAALARIKKTEGQFGLNVMKRKVDTTLKSSLGTGRTSTETDFSGIGTVGIAYPVPTERGSLVFALGYNRVKDFSGRLKVDGYNDYLYGDQTGESIEDGSLGIISIAGAVDVSPYVSLGLSMDIWYGDYRRDNRMLLNDTSELYSQLDITGVDDEISAWSIKPAILYHKDNFRLGAYARLPMTFYIKEYNYLEWYSREDGEYYKLYDNPDPESEFVDDIYSDNMSYRIKAPMQMGLGLAWGTPGRSCLAFDIVYENWTQARLIYPSDYISEPNHFRDKYRSALNWRIGLEKKLPFFNSVGRIGYIHNPLSFKGPRGNEDETSPIRVTDERNFITFGLGKEFDESFKMDIGYSYGIWSQEEAPREDEESRSRVYMSLTYRMLDF